MNADHDAAELGRLLAQRYSCRGFLSKPVPKTTLERIVSLAQRTASWCNAQPWRVHITSGDATERFRQAMLAPAQAGEAGPDFHWPREYQGVYPERRRECGMALYDSVGIKRGDREASTRQGRENFRLFGAPHVVLITSDEALGVYGAVDCGAYVANFMLIASSLGVASIAQASLASRPQRVRDFFGLTPDRQVVCGISLGFAEPAHPANGFRTRRADAAAVVDWVD